MSFRSITLVALLTVAFSGVSMAQQSSVYTDSKGVAVLGYDVVSYFDNERPRMGMPTYSVDHNGITFHFATKENMKAFEKNPEKYTPKYGGYCAYAMGAKGRKISSDPRTYKIIDGDLYLFFNGKMKDKKVNTKKYWEKKEAKLMPKADKNWSSMQADK